MKSAARWFLYEYEHGKLVILSKPFKTKKEAEKARQQHFAREKRKVGIGRSL